MNFKLNISDLGLLLIRVMVGVMFIFVHGYPKLASGMGDWAKLGSVLVSLGVLWPPAAFWGFCAALTEALGGLLFFLGLFTRPVACLLFVVMVVAVIFHFKAGEGLAEASHAIELAGVFLGFSFVGAGAYSLDQGGGK